MKKILFALFSGLALAALAATSIVPNPIDPGDLGQPANPFINAYFGTPYKGGVGIFNTNEAKSATTNIANYLILVATNQQAVANSNIWEPKTIGGAMTNHYTPEAYFAGDLQTEGAFIVNGLSSRFANGMVYFGTNTNPNFGNWINTNGDLSLSGSDFQVTGGFVTAIDFTGEGTHLNNLDASELTLGVMPKERLPATIDADTTGSAAKVATAVTNQWRSDITTSSNGLSARLIATNTALVNLHYNGAGVTNMNSTVVVPGANVTITTNVAANGNRSYTVASSGGGGGGFWVLNSSSGDYTNLFGGRYDEPSTGKTAFYLGTNQTDYMIEGNLWRANLGIQFGATGGSIDGSGDFDLHDGSVNSLTINGTMSTPTFNVTTLNATNVFGFGTAYWTNANNAFNGTAFTNQSLTASRIMMTGANKQQVSATASGATPINADGTAVTSIPISMLSDSTNVFYSANTLDFSVPHASTNMAGNITITTLNGVQNTAYNILVREWGANGADRTITFPTAWRAAPYGGTSVTVTNGTWCKLTLEVQVNYYTNAWFTWAY